MNFEPHAARNSVSREIFVSFLAERVYWISAVVQQGSEHFVTVCDNIFLWNSVFRTHKYEDEVQIQTCRWKWHACMFIQHYVIYAKNWQSVQSEASTSITLTLFAFHSIHCNLFIIDDVGLFVKSSVLKNFSICSKFYCNKCGGPLTMPEENRGPWSKKFENRWCTHTSI